MNNTKLNYLQDHSLSGQAHVVNISCDEKNHCTFILDQTLFYPQGGGQPYDMGIIHAQGDESQFRVNEVRFKDGIVYHIGVIEHGNFNVGDLVNLQVDQQRRDYNSRNHSAGHIVEVAAKACGIKLDPCRGYHFPEGAYIEYLDTIPSEEHDYLKKCIQEKVNMLIAQSIPISVQLVTINDLQQQGSFIPDNIPKDKPLRSMKVEGFPAIPCGGTHSINTDRLKKVIIEKLKNKKGNVRVCYSIAE